MTRCARLRPPDILPTYLAFYIEMSCLPALGNHFLLLGLGH